jgi:phosphate transport system permease protein
MSQRSREVKDFIGEKSMWIFTVLTIVLLFLIAIGLFYKSLPILKVNSLSELLFSSEWYPLKGKFGLWPFILSTLWVTGISIFLAVPLCLLASIYLSEYADRRILQYVNPLIDILAGIPSVIFGIWGIIVIVPLVRDFIAPAMGVSSTGYTILTGGIVLSIMVFPIIIHVLMEVFHTISPQLRNASLSLGATKWQTVKFVVLRKAGPGIISAVVLGLSRAFGETLAVLMVVGNVSKVPTSSLDPGYPLTALLANNYGEMMSIPLYDSALLFSSFILFMIVLFFNIISRIVLRRIENKLD